MRLQVCAGLAAVVLLATGCASSPSRFSCSQTDANAQPQPLYSTFGGIKR